MTRPSRALLLLFASSSSAFTPLQPLSPSTVTSRTITTTTSSTLDMAKNPHRASYERQLEELMDNDWRVFRAKLVAQERIESTSHEKSAHDDDERLKKQKQVTDFFGGVIAAFFKKDKKENNVFDGEFIGGATAEDFTKMVPEGTEDPFLSLEELPTLIPKFKNIDKHRWAHELSHVEPGCVLVANEKLGGVFHQTVVLVIQHSDKHGTMGVVINRYV
jgi:putative transcriptional regulator